VNDIQAPDYGLFIREIKEKIRSSQYEAMKTLNTALITLYWEIGEEIFHQQQEKGWGKSIVEVLSGELKKEFPDVKGFSSANLWRMRNFYLSYRDLPILAPLVREISWTKNLLIMEKCKDVQEREFYIRMTKRYGWTKDVLANHIGNRSYEKYLLNQTNFDETLPEPYQGQAKLAVKDEYVFDFMEMGNMHSEYELKHGLVRHVREFLSEMGGMFAFIGSEYHLIVGGDSFYIDLLLFHRKLRCLVAVELKIGAFVPEYAGKMQFYLAALDEQERLEGENPAIGIIICREKNRTVVEYALRSANRPIGVATYRVLDALPEELRDMLPAPDEIEKRLAALD